jgi:hypothetical protein
MGGLATVLQVPTIRQATEARGARYLRWFPNVMVQSGWWFILSEKIEDSWTKNPLDRLSPQHLFGHSRAYES